MYNRNYSEMEVLFDSLINQKVLHENINKKNDPKNKKKS